MSNLTLRKILGEAQTGGEALEQAIIDKWNAFEQNKDIPEWGKNKRIEIASANALKFLAGVTPNITGEAYKPDKKRQLSEFWKQYKAIDSTPKTDIVIGAEKISLKMGHNAQIITSQKNEALATLMAACKNAPNTEEIEHSAERIFKDFVENELIIGTVNSVKERIKLKKRSKTKEEKRSEQIVEKAEKVHKEMKGLLESYFQSSPHFASAFVKEAMTGQEKFISGDIGVAEKIMVVSTDGKRVLYRDVDDEITSRIAKNLELRVSWKTRSIKRKGAPSGLRSLYSTLRLAAKKADEIEKESVSMVEDAMYDVRGYSSRTLSEGILEGWMDGVVRSAVIQKVKEKIGSIIKIVVDVIKSGIHKLIEFLDLEPEVKVSETFNADILF